MSKKTKLLSNSSSSSSSWPWTACVANPKTLSFRASAEEEDIFKTMNSAYRDSSDFSSSSESEDEGAGGDSIETVIKGLRSERLFFEPDETSSILRECDNNKSAAVESPLLRDSVTMEMDSSDPYLDFRRSMEEMLEAHERVMNSWDCLEELLACYLRVNGQSNHGYIVGAFVDLLISLSIESAAAAAAAAEETEEEEEDCAEYKSACAEDRCCCTTTPNSQYSFTSPLSFHSSTTSFTSPCLSSLEAEEEVQKPVHNSASSSSLSNISTSCCNNYGWEAPETKHVKLV